MHRCCIAHGDEDISTDVHQLKVCDFGLAVDFRCEWRCVVIKECNTAFMAPEIF